LPELSLILFAHDRAEQVAQTVHAVGAARARFAGDIELIVVDDASTDVTLARTRALLTGRPWLRLLRLEHEAGVGGATAAGVHAARGRWIATLDVDSGYSLDDLILLWERARRDDADWVQGRRPTRGTSGATRLSSAFERLLLGSAAADPTCTLRVFRAELGRRLPLPWRGVARFLPIYAARLGARVVEMGVQPLARPAPSDVPTLERLTDELLDLLAVRWMLARGIDVESVELRLPATLAEEQAADGRAPREPAPTLPTP